MEGTKFDQAEFIDKGPLSRDSAFDVAIWGFKGCSHSRVIEISKDGSLNEARYPLIHDYEN